MYDRVAEAESITIAIVVLVWPELVPPIKTHMAKLPPTPEYALTPILFGKILSIIIRVVEMPP